MRHAPGDDHAARRARARPRGRGLPRAAGPSPTTAAWPGTRDRASSSSSRPCHSRRTPVHPTTRSSESRMRAHRSGARLPGRTVRVCPVRQHRALDARHRPIQPRQRRRHGEAPGREPHGPSLEARGQRSKRDAARTAVPRVAVNRQFTSSTMPAHQLDALPSSAQRRCGHDACTGKPVRTAGSRGAPRSTRPGCRPATRPRTA